MLEPGYLPVESVLGELSRGALEKTSQDVQMWVVLVLGGQGSGCISYFYCCDQYLTRSSLRERVILAVEVQFIMAGKVEPAEGMWGGCSHGIHSQGTER